jgi:hypothetical protein
VGWLAGLVWLWPAAAPAEGLLKRPAWPGISVEGREIRAKKYGKKDDEFSSLRVDVWIHELSCPRLALSTLCASKTWFSCCRLLSVRAYYCVFGRPRLVSGLRVYVSMIRLVRQRSSTAKLQIVSRGYSVYKFAKLLVDESVQAFGRRVPIERSMRTIINANA